MPAIHTDNAPKAIGPYSQAVAVGDLVFVSGQLPIDPATGIMPDDVASQAAQCLKNLAAILAEAGLGLQHVVKATVFLKSMDDFAAMNEVYAQYFKPPYPARAAFAVAALPKDARVEIEVVAHRANV